jgi:alpha-galactosidase
VQSDGGNVSKIVLIGAGSVSFGPRTLADLFVAREALKGSTISLVDINPGSLALVKAVADRANARAGRPFIIEATTDRAGALDGADFVIISIAVERNKRWKLDFEIPLRHGVKQVLGENGGPGGLFHAMRNIPIVLDICRDIEGLAPDALVLNYTNPEGRICLAANRYTDLQFVGLCHGIGMAQDAISQVTGIPVDDIDPKAGGLNHFNWILDLRRKSTGEDIYPLFKQAIAEKGVEHVTMDGGYGFGVKLSRYLMDVYGLWPLPSDDHVGEYLGYAWEYCGLHGYDFAAADRHGRELYETLHNIASGAEPVDPYLEHTSGEIAIPIITGVLGNTHQYELAVNVPNKGLIPNLPDWAIVEVPATIDATGVHGVPVGPLPEPIAAMCRAQIAVIDRMVEAAVHGDRNAALQALLLDPTITSISQAEAILEELLAVHADLLPQFA